MLAQSRRLKLLLIHKITKLPPFTFSALSTTTTTSIASPQSLIDELPNKSYKSSSFTVSYLIDSCGLSPELAISASKKLELKSRERPDLVIQLFKNYGFDETHISRLVRGCPCLLLLDPGKNLLPKLHYLHSIGFSTNDLVSVLTHRPVMLTRSLENHTIPITRFLKNVLKSDKKVVSFFKRTMYDFGMKYVVPNITSLRDLKVPDSNVLLLTTHYPCIVLQEHDRFMKVIDKAKEMGFDPLKSTFVLALRVLLGDRKKLVWNRCSEAYKKWGWSKNDILSAFHKQPQCMVLSDMKIDKTMAFFVNKMGCQPIVISEIPSVLLFSLERRIVPRCSVVQVLIARGLINTRSLYTILAPAEKEFLEKYVTKYEEELPELMSVYRGEVVVPSLR